MKEMVDNGWTTLDQLADKYEQMNQKFIDGDYGCVFYWGTGSEYGATKVQSFFRITLPLILKNVVTLCIPFTMFDLVYAMTSGGPGEDTALIAYRITTEAFTNLNIGYASALAVMLFAVMIVFSMVNMKFVSKMEN